MVIKLYLLSQTVNNGINICKIDKFMKANLSSLNQRVQKVVQEAKKENEEIEMVHSKLGDHFQREKENLVKTYEAAGIQLFDKKKQFTEMLKVSLAEQKTAIEKQKNKTTQKIEQALGAREKLSRFKEKMDSASYEEYFNINESITKELAELETFVGTLGHIKPIYLQFHEDITISDKSEIVNKNSKDDNKEDLSNENLARAHSSSRRHHKHSDEKANEESNNQCGKNGVEEDGNQNNEASHGKNSRKKETRGAKTSRHPPASPKDPNYDGARFFSPNGHDGEPSEMNGCPSKIIPKIEELNNNNNVCNPFVEESLLAKLDHSSNKAKNSGTQLQGKGSSQNVTCNTRYSKGNSQEEGQGSKPLREDSDYANHEAKA